MQTAATEIQLLMRRDQLVTKTIDKSRDRAAEAKPTMAVRRSFSSRLEFQTADVLDVGRPARPIERDDDGETDRDLSRGDRDDEENEDLRVVIGQARGVDAKARERDERKIGRIQHQLERHENDDEVAPQDARRQNRS